MAKKALAVRFDKTDKGLVKGKVGHTRTGACTSRGKCYHGWKKSVRTVSR
jgi:hypothetical protein